MTYEQALVALADGRRRQIFESLRLSGRSVNEIAAEQPVSRPAVSQHLKVLEDAGLVGVRKMGTRRIYSVRREGLQPLKQYLESFWDDVLGAYVAHIEEEVDRDHD